MLKLGFTSETIIISQPIGPVVIGPVDMHPRCHTGVDQKVCSGAVFQPALMD